MRDRVAQQVFERCGHLLQYAAVDLDASAAQVERGALAEFACALPHHPVEPAGEAVEGQHAHLHQALLQLARHARLAAEREFGAVQVVQQALLHGGHVVHALRHHPRELLQAGVAVELERIEVGVPGAGLGDARLHLHLGLDLDLAQLVAQADHVLGEVEQRTPQAAQLALDPAARDADLAGLVDEAVDALGAHPQGGGGEGLGLGRGLPATFFRAGGRGGRLQRRFAEGELVDDLLAAVDAVRERLGEHCGRLTRGETVLQMRFELVQVGAEAHCPRHARAALERVQQACDRARCLLVVGLRAPAAQGGVELGGGLGGLFEEDRQQLGVDVVLRMLRRARLRAADRHGHDCGRDRRIVPGDRGGCGVGVRSGDRFRGAPWRRGENLFVDGLEACDEFVRRRRCASCGDLLAHRAQGVEGVAEQRQIVHPRYPAGIGEPLQPVLQSAAEAMRGLGAHGARDAGEGVGGAYPRGRGRMVCAVQRAQLLFERGEVLGRFAAVELVQRARDLAIADALRVAGKAGAGFAGAELVRPVVRCFERRDAFCMRFDRRFAERCRQGLEGF